MLSERMESYYPFAAKCLKNKMAPLTPQRKLNERFVGLQETAGKEENN